MPLVKHKEGLVKILAPDDVDKCVYYPCRAQGDFRLVALNDKDEYVFEYKNICSKHLIFAFIDFLEEP